jgi:small subunit ribosomal protein S9
MQTDGVTMKQFHESGKRKRAIAKATVKPGTGKVYVNGISLDAFQPKVARMRMMEPIQLAEGLVDKFDVWIRTNGGGYMGQAEAARLAMARAFVEATKSGTLKATFLEYDRHMLVADKRRKEMRKPNDSKARAARQKSYR